MDEFTSIKERDGGKIPTTTVTNELARAVQSLGPKFLSGQIFNDQKIPTQHGVIVHLTSSIVGAIGQYNGRTRDDSGVASAGDNVIVSNRSEDGGGGTNAMLQVGYDYPGVYLGTFDPATGKPLVWINPVPIGNVATPTTLGAASEGSETALTTDWGRGATPLDLYVVSRVVYNEAGDKKIYKYLRKLSFDACGLLVIVSAETRVEVDATEACT